MSTYSITRPPYNAPLAAEVFRELLSNVHGGLAVRERAAKDRALNFNHCASTEYDSMTVICRMGQPDQPLYTLLLQFPYGVLEEVGSVPAIAKKRKGRFLSTYGRPSCSGSHRHRSYHRGSRGKADLYTEQWYTKSFQRIGSQARTRRLTLKPKRKRSDERTPSPYLFSSIARLPYVTCASGRYRSHLG